MMYQVNYMKPKKKGYAQQKATFLEIEDAVILGRTCKEESERSGHSDYCPLIF